MALRDLQKLNFKATHLFMGLLSAGVFGFILLYFLMGYTTSNPSYCLSCHYKQSHIDWIEKSLVHPPIKCIECHVDKKLIIPQYFNADDDRINNNCVRCHEKRIMTDETKGFKYNIGNIKIPHRLHLKDVGASCMDCHRNIIHDKTGPKTNRPRMEYCYNCHDREKTDCSKCHP